MRGMVRVGWLMLFSLVTVILGACGTLTNSAEVSDLETRSAQLQSTIDGLGTPAATIVALQMTAERGVQLQIEMSGLQGTALAMQQTLTALQLGGVPSQPQVPAPAVTPGQPAAVPATTPAASQTTFAQTVLSPGVRDADGCATSPTTSFDPTTSQIYVVTSITNLKAGSVLSARWRANGTLFFDDAQCWIPSSDWASVCAYCSIVPDDGAFESGSWTVELLLNGQLMAQAQFQVTGPAATPAPADTVGG